MFITIPYLHRKVEDLQFQIEEEAITKDDLEVNLMVLNLCVT